MSQTQWKRIIYQAIRVLSLLILAVGLLGPAAGAGATPAPVAAPSSEPGFVQVAAGVAHTCALTSTGGVKCWGNNQYGQLGAAAGSGWGAPVDMYPLSSGVTAIAAADDHTCALANGAVWCWGGGPEGYHTARAVDGLVYSATPQAVEGLGSSVIAMDTGLTHTCAVLSSGEVLCWGQNSAGQLGDGTTDSHTDPVLVQGLDGPASAITVDGLIFYPPYPGPPSYIGHTCALMQSGEVKCWGDKIWGEGAGTIGSNNFSPVDVIGLGGPVTAISAGPAHTCALMQSGGVRCWGTNDHGELGNGTWEASNTPTDVVGLQSGVAEISAGQVNIFPITSADTCVRLFDGGMKCWGGGDAGRLGDGSAEDRNTPVDVLGLPDKVTAIATGYRHTCAVVARHGTMCWGDNANGQLGIGKTHLRNTVPADVLDVSGPFLGIWAGDWKMCARAMGGAVMCWGWSYDQPTEEPSLQGATAIALGNDHTCAIFNGEVKCMGLNNAGQLGDGTTTDSPTMVDVVGLPGQAIAVAVGRYHSCALVSGGAVMCWGHNAQGQLGNGINCNYETGEGCESLTPVDVVGLQSGVTAIDAVWDRNCAVSDGGVKCWGDWWTSTPQVVIPSSSGATAVSIGKDAHNCAVVAGGVKCWGDNRFGQLGDGTNTWSDTPVNVVGLQSGVLDVQAFGDVYEYGVSVQSGFSCALLTNGSVKCWGHNARGQLGDGTAWDRSTPGTVAGLAGGASAIAGGIEHVCALVGTGRPKCWGNNYNGQLGLWYGPYLSSSLLPAYVYGSTPTLTLNYADGKPGSFFTLTGWDFPAGNDLTLSVNGVVFPGTVRVSPTGNFIVFIRTNGASPGVYRLGVSGMPSASASFTLADGASVRVIEGGGQTFSVPPALGWTDFSYIPLLIR